MSLYLSTFKKKSTTVMDMVIIGTIISKILIYNKVWAYGLKTLNYNCKILSFNSTMP